MNKLRATLLLASVGIRVARLAALIFVAVSLMVLPTFLVVAVIGDATGWYRVEDHMTMGPAAESPVDPAHREIADIFHRRYLEFVSPGPRLVPLDDQCHPPGSCTCWVSWDPSDASELENDLGRWHRAKSSIFTFLSRQVPYRVDVRRLERHAYSVLACEDPGP